MSKILIIGANGSVGKSCVTNLKDDNELVLLSRSAFDGDVEGSYEKNVEDERDAIFEFYAMRLSGVIFGISIVLILVLLGWFNLHINFAIIAITLSGFLASISANILKIYLYETY